ncbi:MAG: hypothetical protein V1800_06760 [Candidatus Latescibacterota bacterium]
MKRGFVLVVAMLVLFGSVVYAQQERKINLNPARNAAFTGKVGRGLFKKGFEPAVAVSVPQFPVKSGDALWLCAAATNAGVEGMTWAIYWDVAGIKAYFPEWTFEENRMALDGFTIVSQGCVVPPLAGIVTGTFCAEIYRPNEPVLGTACQPVKLVGSQGAPVVEPVVEEVVEEVTAEGGAE